MQILSEGTESERGSAGAEKPAGPRGWKKWVSAPRAALSGLRRNSNSADDLKTPTPASANTLAKVTRNVGGFFALSMDIIVQTFRPPFPWSEFVIQSWFVARVSIVPAIALSVPFNAFTVFLFNVLLVDIGAADFSGAAASLTCIEQIGPVTAVLVVAGAGATAMCADLGARTIREELDAMRVMGLDPVRMLLVPRLAALTLNAFLLIGIANVIGIAGDYIFSVYFQHVTPGAFAASLTVLTGLRQVIVSIAKAVLFGAAAGCIACYKGVTVVRGPAGVGNAVNETVVLSFIALFVINMVLTAIDAQGITAA